MGYYLPSPLSIQKPMLPEKRWEQPNLFSTCFCFCSIRKPSFTKDTRRAIFFCFKLNRVLPPSPLNYSKTYRVFTKKNPQKLKMIKNDSHDLFFCESYAHNVIRICESYANHILFAYIRMIRMIRKRESYDSQDS